MIAARCHCRAAHCQNASAPAKPVPQPAVYAAKRPSGNSLQHTSTAEHALARVQLNSAGRLDEWATSLSVRASCRCSCSLITALLWRSCLTVRAVCASHRAALTLHVLGAAEQRPAGAAGRVGDQPLPGAGLQARGAQRPALPGAVQAPAGASACEQGALHRHKHRCRRRRRRRRRRMQSVPAVQKDPWTSCRSMQSASGTSSTVLCSTSSPQHSEAAFVPLPVRQLRLAVAAGRVRASHDIRADNRKDIGHGVGGWLSSAQRWPATRRYGLACSL